MSNFEMYDDELISSLHGSFDLKCFYRMQLLSHFEMYNDELISPLHGSFDLKCFYCHAIIMSHFEMNDGELRKIHLISLKYYYQES